MGHSHSSTSTVYRGVRTPLVVGLTGRAGSGKDTVADYLVAEHGFTKISMAGPLKRAVVELFGLDPSVFEDRVRKEAVVEDWGRSPRWLAQWLGTDVLRKEIDEEVFTKTAKRRIAAVANGRVVVSDVRFDNEARMVHELGGVVWRLDANVRLEGTEGRMGMTEAAHSTEAGIAADLCDATLDTNTAWATTRASAVRYLRDAEAEADVTG